MAKGKPPKVPAPKCRPGTTPHFARGKEAVATWCELPDGRKDGPYVEWWDHGQMRLRGQYQDGGRTGTWITWSRRGKCAREVEFWEGDVHGKARFWYSSGHPWKKGQYYRNQEHERWVWLHDGGGRWLEGRYERGKKQGVWQQWSQDGKLLGQSKFEGGTGIDTRFFDDGSMSARIPYINGKKHGKATRWHENGQRKAQEHWNDGRPTGHWINWDESGRVVESQDFGDPMDGPRGSDTQMGIRTNVFFKRAQRGVSKFLKLPTSKLYSPDEATEIREAEAVQGNRMPHAAYVAGEITEIKDTKPGPDVDSERLRKFYRDRNGSLMRIETFLHGKRSKTVFYRGGEPYRIQRWHPSGNSESEGELDGLMRHGTWTHWHDNGQRSFIGSYDSGVTEGRFTRWNRDGRMLGEFDIAKGNGTWWDWHDNGRVREHGMLVDGREHGPWTYYDEEGAVVKAILFEHGEVTSLDANDTLVG